MVTQELISFVNQQRQNGVKDVDIEAILVKNGWTQADVAQVLNPQNIDQNNLDNVNQGPTHKYKYNVLVKILNILITLYLFITALIFSFMAVLSFPVLLVQNKIGFGWYQTAMFSILHISAFVIFIVSKKRYSIVPWILTAIITWSIGIWIYYRSFEIGNLITILIYGIPIILLFIIKHIKKEGQTIEPEKQGDLSSKTILETQASSLPFTNSAVKQSFWKKESYIILFILLIQPLGVFLMWKYTHWRRWVKEVITAWFVLSIIPTLFLWSTLGVVNGLSFYNDIFNPKTVNKSQEYNCNPINTEWSKCVNIKYGFSFEYPSKWNYVDEGSDYLVFSPYEKASEKWLISFSFHNDWDDEAQAKSFTDGIIPSENIEKIKVDGLYATREKTILDGDVRLHAVILNKKNTYQFDTTFDLKGFIKDTGLSIGDEELEKIFDHMTNSFTVGNKTSVVSPTSTPELTITPSLGSTPTANWKTYINTDYSFQLTFTDKFEGYTVKKLPNPDNSMGASGSPLAEYTFSLPTTDRQYINYGNNPAQVFNIAVYSQDKWDWVTNQGGSKPTIIISSNDKVFTYSLASQWPSDWELQGGQNNDVKPIIDSFKFVN